jgi:hypothetical protein
MSGNPNNDDGRRTNPDDIARNAMMITFYNNQYVPNVHPKLVSTDGIARLITLVSDQFRINISNNIWMHFEKYVWRFIKCSFPKPTDMLAKDYYPLIEKIKNALYLNEQYVQNNDDRNPFDKVNSWLKRERSKIIPQGFNPLSIKKDVDIDNMRYIHCMHYMNAAFEANETKAYQIIPIHTQFYDNYVKFDTQALFYIMYESNIKKFATERQKILDTFGKKRTKREIWNGLFNFKTSDGKEDLFNLRDYTFNNEITTDGYSVSVCFIHKDDVPRQKAKNKAKQDGKKEARQENEVLAQQPIDDLEKAKRREAKAKAKNDKEKNNAIATAEYKKIQAAKFKQLSAAEKEFILVSKNKTAEFPYIEHLVLDPNMKPKIQKAFDEKRLVVVDPGKRSILFMMGEQKPNEPSPKARIDAKQPNNFGIHFPRNSGKHPVDDVRNNKKFLNYTSSMRRRSLRIAEYDKKRTDWVINGIQPIDHPTLGKIKLCPQFKSLIYNTLSKKLCDTSNRTCDLKKFYEYIKARAELVEFVQDMYDMTLFHKLKWYAYLNKMHHENDLLNEIQKEFGKEAMIIIGDWSGKGRIRYAPTPNIALKRKLAERFNVYFIDEYNTSKLHHKYETECGNLKTKSTYSQQKQKLIMSLCSKLGKRWVWVNLLKLKCDRRVQKMSDEEYTRKRNEFLEALEKELPKKLVEMKKTINSELENDRKVYQDKQGRYELHAVLTYKVVNTGMNVAEPSPDKEVNGNPMMSGCINRDRNSVYNMYKIVKHLLDTRKRPNGYCREYDPSKKEAARLEKVKKREEVKEQKRLAKEAEKIKKQEERERKKQEKTKNVAKIRTSLAKAKQ